MKVLRACAVAFFAVTAAASVTAQNYPIKPIKLIVPFAPGSATDMLGRLVAQGLSERLGQPVIVEPKPGAGTSIGAQAVENSAPDGYTVLLGTNATFAVNSILYKKLPYDPLGFSFVATAGGMPSFLIVSGQSKHKSLADFIKDAKANPGKVSYASSGVGSTGHLVGKVLENAAGIDLLHVPYKDGPQGLSATMTGEVNGIFYTSIAAMPMITAGRVRPLAVSTQKRTPELPNVPTISESGYGGFDFSGWGILAVPKKTPQAVTDKLREAAYSLYSNADFQAKLEKIGMQQMPQLSGRELEAFVAKERDRMVDVATRSNIQPE
ncbi:Bug family tripartite tricarboxylate transporter substrate binding protein [Ottowia thiooxydans]|uniref:Bug family tripartite tricarboxylate transporter substrate binding protein n=1 Tax=Ottowia thiooxydans TaxID=219182 RepID=UPI0003F58B8C|nr:tripartite tricarboxylate transporter substrate binding protein [Ottowia thiooxydans]